MQGTWLQYWWRGSALHRYLFLGAFFPGEHRSHKDFHCPQHPQLEKSQCAITNLHLFAAVTERLVYDWNLSRNTIVERVKAMDSGITNKIMLYCLTYQKEINILQSASFIPVQLFPQLETEPLELHQGRKGMIFTSLINTTYSKTQHRPGFNAAVWRMKDRQRLQTLYVPKK